MTYTVLGCPDVPVVSFISLHLMMSIQGDSMFSGRPISTAPGTVRIYHANEYLPDANPICSLYSL